MAPVCAFAAAAASTLAKKRATRAHVARRTPPCCATSRRVSRRDAVASAAAAAVAVLLEPRSANAVEVQSYVDLPKGFKMMRPSGWNEFEATAEAYDIKWADVIQPLEFITVLTSPVSAGKSLAGIGDVRTVGQKLAAARGGELVDAKEKDIDGIPAYVYEIRKGAAHQLTLLTVNKSKLYSVNASSGEKRWKKREKLLRSVVDSFQPKL